MSFLALTTFPLMFFGGLYITSFLSLIGRSYRTYRSEVAIVPMALLQQSKSLLFSNVWIKSAKGLAGAVCYKHTLPDLPYDYNALEPTISAEIMKIHHQKHHQTYVTGLNTAEEKLQEALSKGDVNTAVSLGPALRFNGGGHINHSIFWTNLCKGGSGEPSGPLLEQIKRDFGSFDKMKSVLSEKSTTLQGSGWGWLGYCNNQKCLKVTTCPNQDPLQASTGLVPLLGIDVWEHAYYLQYKNVRADYVKGIWNIVNWKNVAERFEKAKKL